MDARHFDALSRALSVGDSRRRLLALLATLPLLGGLAALLDPDDAHAAGRRKRRKKRHKHGDNRRKRKTRKKKKPNHPACTPDARAQTCAGQCGAVPNNCGVIVDCGSCECSPACGECFTCQGAAGSPGACVPSTSGTACGVAATCADGTFFPQGRCDGDGNCLSGIETPCDPYLQCNGNACATSCSTDDDCVAGAFCNGDGRCVGDGATGQPCTRNGQCASGFCVDEVCCENACETACFACNVPDNLGACIPDPAELGETCGAAGQVCQADGGCTCDASSCPDCTTCGGDGQCVPCADCCDQDGVCQPGETNAACGSSGNCEVCTSPQTCGGGGTPQQCGCTPQSDATTCAGKCGSVVNNCGQTVDCTPFCTGCCTGAICQPGTDSLYCGSGGGTCVRCTSPQTCGGGGSAGVCGCTPITTCPAGKNCGPISDGCGGTVNCGTCGNSAPVCTSNVCGSCTSTAQCSGGLACVSGSCQACTSHAQCGTNQICDGGTCRACKVCGSGCAHTTVSSAIGAATSGDTIGICPGTYDDSIEITKNVTLVGAGSGAGGTTLAVTSGGPVVAVVSAEVDLRDLQVTGANRPTSGGGGIWNKSGSTLSLTRVLVTGNLAFTGGGILNFGKLTLNAGTTVTANTARQRADTGAGGGIYNNIDATLILNAGSAVTDNTAPADAIGGGVLNRGTLTRDPGSTVSGNTPDDCRNSNGTTC